MAEREWKGWIWEALIAWDCWMVGVNVAHSTSAHNTLRGAYLHIGPIILGVWRWLPQPEALIEHP